MNRKYGTIYRKEQGDLDEEYPLYSDYSKLPSVQLEQNQLEEPKTQKRTSEVIKPTPQAIDFAKRLQKFRQENEMASNYPSITDRLTDDEFEKEQAYFNPFHKWVGRGTQPMVQNKGEQFSKLMKYLKK